MSHSKLPSVCAYHIPNDKSLTLLLFTVFNAWSIGPVVVRTPPNAPTAVDSVMTSPFFVKEAIVFLTPLKKFCQWSTCLEMRLE